MTAALEQILAEKIVAVVRLADASRIIELGEALLAGGVRVIEITFTIPDPLGVLKQVREVLGSRVLLGAGTVLDPETGRAAILAGAEFLVSPTINLDVLKMGIRYGKTVIPGGLTPTEILTAYENGASLIKVFPADAVGPTYFKAMLGPFPQIKLMPTGGMDLAGAESYLRAGAVCLGLGGSLVDRQAVAAGDWPKITEKARAFVDVVKRTASPA